VRQCDWGFVALQAVSGSARLQKVLVREILSLQSTCGRLLFLRKYFSLQGGCGDSGLLIVLIQPAVIGFQDSCSE
jgi:hypothetical protein